MLGAKYIYHIFGYNLNKIPQCYIEYLRNKLDDNIRYFSINNTNIQLIKETWKLPEFTYYKNIKIKNFMGGKEINWKIRE